MATASSECAVLMDAVSEESVRGEKAQSQNLRKTKGGGGSNIPAPHKSRGVFPEAQASGRIALGRSAARKVSPRRMA